MQSIRPQRGRLRNRGPLERAAEAGRRIRSDLDSEVVIHETVECLQQLMPAPQASLWLTTGTGSPALAHSSELRRANHSSGMPEAVQRVASRWRPFYDEKRDIVAAPIVAPGTGLLGVLVAAGRVFTPEEQAFVGTLAEEAGFALQAANLFESALAQKEKSEAILSGVADAVMVTDSKGVILESNPASARILERPGTEVLHHKCQEIAGLHKGDQKLDCRNGCPLLAFTSPQSLELGIEVWRYRTDGRKQPLLANVSALADADGNVSQVVHSIRDITRIKEADEVKAMFLANATHELKTPLAVILGFSQLLKAADGISGPDRLAALDAMHERAVELNEIVERLLLSSRIDSGDVQVAMGDIDVVPGLKESVEAISRSAGRQIDLWVDPDLPKIQGDAAAFITIVEHLLNNALKYSPQGGPIQVKALAELPWVRFSVGDHGIGMDSQQMAQCFDKFWQAESSEVRQYGGIGIGLFIVASLVESMGGEIAAEGAPGQGCNFSFTLRQAGLVAPQHRDEPKPEPEFQRIGGEPSAIREFMRQIGIPERRQ